MKIPHMKKKKDSLAELNLVVDNGFKTLDMGFLNIELNRKLKLHWKHN